MRKWRKKRRLKKRDLLRKIEEMKIGKMRMRLWEWRLGMRKGNNGISILKGGDWIEGIEKIEEI